MTNVNFIGMDAGQIAEAIFNAPTAEEVSASFKALEAVDPAVSKPAVDILETMLVKDTREGVAEFDQMKPLLGLIDFADAFSAAAGGKGIEPDAEDIADHKAMQAVAQTFAHINALKGNAADPLTKAVVVELAKITAEEYNSVSSFAVEQAASRAVASLKPPAAPGPFAPPKGPKI